MVDGISAFLEKRKVAIVILLVLISICIRGFQISNESLWLDEAHTAAQSVKSWSTIVDEARNDQNPPLYFLLMNRWVKLFGISEIALRSFSLLCNLAALVFLFHFARKHLNIVTAVIAG